MMKTGTSRRSRSARSLPHARTRMHERARRVRKARPSKRKPRLIAGAFKDTACENDLEPEADGHTERARQLEVAGCAGSRRGRGLAEVRTAPPVHALDGRGGERIERGKRRILRSRKDGRVAAGLSL